jgi:hypothetical protein
VINGLKMTKADWWGLVCFSRRDMNNARVNYSTYRATMKGKSHSERCSMLNDVKVMKKELKFQVNRMNTLFGNKYGRV